MKVIKGNVPMWEGVLRGADRIGLNALDPYKRTGGLSRYPGTPPRHDKRCRVKPL